jgi:tyrosinase
VTAKANCSFRNSADRYHFTLSAPATVTIGLSSAAFDTYVCLYNSVDQFLASDDNSGGGTNSRLVQSLLAGDYYIEVTTVSPGGAGGAYSLSLQ